MREIEQDELAQMYADIFETNRVGQIIFEDLIRRFGNVPDKSEGIDRVLDQFQYAGQRAVIEYITLKINQANGVTDVDSSFEIPTDG